MAPIHGPLCKEIAPPCSLAHIKRKCSEAKWTDASKWVKAQLARTSNSKYRPSDKQKPNATVAQANKKLAVRFYQLKRGYCLTGQYLQWTTRRPDAKCWWCNYKRKASRRLWAAVREEPAGVRISELFADERCSKPILGFLATTAVCELNKMPPPPGRDGIYRSWDL